MHPYNTVHIIRKALDGKGISDLLRTKKNKFPFFFPFLLISKALNNLPNLATFNLKFSLIIPSLKWPN
jgi:hypothetical protein